MDSLIILLRPLPCLCIISPSLPSLLCLLFTTFLPSPFTSPFPSALTVDQIYHLASPASPKYYMYNPVKTLKTNTIGTLNMLGEWAHTCTHTH